MKEGARSARIVFDTVIKLWRQCRPRTPLNRPGAAKPLNLPQE